MDGDARGEIVLNFQWLSWARELMTVPLRRGKWHALANVCAQFAGLQVSQAGHRGQICVVKHMLQVCSTRQMRVGYKVK